MNLNALWHQDVFLALGLAGLRAVDGVVQIYRLLLPLCEK